MRGKPQRKPIELLRPLDREEAFTLIELLIVVNVLGILLLLAAPSYRSFQDRATRAAAKANVREAVTAVDSFFQDNATYVGMTTAALATYNRSLPTITIRSVTATTYCISSQVGTWVAYRAGPHASVTTAACS